MRQASSGMNVDPLNPGGRPDPQAVAALGFGSVRLVLRQGVLDYLDRCVSADLRVLGVIARESGDPERYRGWPLDSLQVGNEPDQRGESSWTMRPEEFYELWYWTRDCFPGVPLIVGGMASGIVDRAEPFAAVEQPAGLGVHPYGKTAEEARALLRAYRELGLPAWVTEWNRPAGEIPDFAAMLHGEAEAGFWFCWSDVMVPGFGLVDGDGNPKPEYHAMAEVLRMPEYVLGFKALADRLGRDVVGEPVEDEHYFPDGRTSLQQTTRGLMIYSKDANQPLFLPAQLPNS